MSAGRATTRRLVVRVLAGLTCLTFGACKDSNTLTAPSNAEGTATVTPAPTLTPRAPTVPPASTKTPASPATPTTTPHPTPAATPTARGPFILRGTVRNPHHRTVADATVKILTGPQRGQLTYTDMMGRYLLNDLSRGTFEVRAEKGTLGYTQTVTIVRDTTLDFTIWLYY